VRNDQSVQLPQLFDLDNDLSETTDVSNEYPEVVARLTALAEKARADLGDGTKTGLNQRAAGLVQNPRGLTDPE